MGCSTDAVATTLSQQQKLKMLLSIQPENLFRSSISHTKSRSAKHLKNLKTQVNAEIPVKNSAFDLMLIQT